jgi:hypothetical protein
MDQCNSHGRSKPDLDMGLGYTSGGGEVIDFVEKLVAGDEIIPSVVMHNKIIGIMRVLRTHTN